jgi:hypothetical protein
VLGDPGPQPLLGGRQLDEALVDVAGNAAAHHLAFGLAQREHRRDRLHHDGGGQEDQHEAQATAEHARVVAGRSAAGTLVIRRSSGRQDPLMQGSNGVQAGGVQWLLDGAVRRMTRTRP